LQEDALLSSFLLSEQLHFFYGCLPLTHKNKVPASLTLRVREWRLRQ
jgi:hypothetical protein